MTDEREQRKAQLKIATDAYLAGEISLAEWLTEWDKRAPDYIAMARDMAEARKQEQESGNGVGEG